MTQEELDKIVEQHQHWLKEDCEGWEDMRANLAYANLEVAARNAGIEFQGEATNHRFRHSFASNLIRAGADIKSVQLLMRHENVEITLNTYSHLLGADLEKAVDKIG